MAPGLLRSPDGAGEPRARGAAAQSSAVQLWQERAASPPAPWVGSSKQRQCHAWVKTPRGDSSPAPPAVRLAAKKKQFFGGTLCSPPFPARGSAQAGLAARREEQGVLFESRTSPTKSLDRGYPSKSVAEPRADPVPRGSSSLLYCSIPLLSRKVPLKPPGRCRSTSKPGKPSPAPRR